MLATHLSTPGRIQKTYIVYQLALALPEQPLVLWVCELERHPPSRNRYSYLAVRFGD